ncbi:Ger(x)C family spore germination protein [Halalkalibacterium halodurans]|uniref:Ger(x)C family spore germination protein n=1 Tax=Halalkalibacterium halodurans TaxID=86665 RepID=UPI001419826A|nr:Ger(x)C family spore germination protein [Halalkalibacterium halodurans]MED3648061.1 Ger(x)C family spore germination protein [Halalkalibacterium halodurans]
MMKSLLSAIFLIAIPGCVEMSIVDNNTLIHSLGYDYIDENTIEGTINMPVYGPREKVTSQSISTRAHTSRDLRSELNRQTPLPIHVGRLSSIIFNRQLAEEIGLIQTIDTFMRDPKIGMRIYLGIAEGSAKDVLMNKYDIEEEVASYLRELIDQNIRTQNLPQTNLHLFLRDYYAEGQDPYLPYLVPVANRIAVDGLALFKGDKFVYHLDEEYLCVIKILLERVERGPIKLRLPNGDFTVLRSVNSYSTYHITGDLNQPKVEIVLHFKGRVTEYTGRPDKGIDEATYEMIKQQLANKLENEAKELTSLFQSLEIDPLGLGSRMKAQTRGFDIEKWEAVYPTIPIETKAEIKIYDTGVRE